MTTRRFIFHPLFVLIVALIGASIYGIYATLRFPGDTLPSHLHYVVPIIVPFVAFLFDRAERFRECSIIQFVVDALTIGAAMGRVTGHVPLCQGTHYF
ncbi:MAG: hypothetical protein ABR568_06505 [Pyrinomonadaceae bacterium]